MNKSIIWVSETGLIVSLTEEGYLLEDPLADEPIQLCDQFSEFKRILEDIEHNPFRVGDKVRVKRAEAGDAYGEKDFDTVYYLANNGSMCIEFYDDGISACVYTWEDLRAYTEESTSGKDKQ